jgi:hypothetical protein
MLFKQLICHFIFTITFVLPKDHRNELNTGSQDPCASIVISVDVARTPGDDSTVSVKVNGAKSPILYFFSTAKGDLVSEDYRKATVQNLKPGKYTCLVKDAGNCRKKIEFEIK